MREEHAAVIRKAKEVEHYRAKVATAGRKG